VSEHTAKNIEDYLRDYRHMSPFARHELAFRLVSDIEAQIWPPPPVSIPPLDILATVVATRRKQLGIG